MTEWNIQIAEAAHFWEKIKGALFGEEKSVLIDFHVSIHFMTECEKKDYNILWHSSIDCSRLKATFWYRFSKLLCGDHAWDNMLISCHDHPVRHHDHDVFLHK